MKVVILCGGLGTRMREETEFRPKPMVKIGARPILWHIMMTYAHYGFKDFVLCLGYKGEVIKEYFFQLRNLQQRFHRLPRREENDRGSHSNGSLDWRVSLIDTGAKALEGARIKQVEHLIDGDTFMLTYGDGVANININELLAFHTQHQKIGTVTGVRPPSLFGELKVREGQVELFTEKPQTSNGLISGGFFVFGRKVFDYLSTADDCDFEKGPLEQLAQEGQLMVYEHRSEWACADTYRDLEHLNQLWATDQAFCKTWE